MEASIVDLRYKMKDVLKALDRREVVHILYHGKRKGVLMPEPERTDELVIEHPFFAMAPEPESGAGPSVEQVMESLRGGRYR